jgi:hypothetical protein
MESALLFQYDINYPLFNERHVPIESHLFLWLVVSLHHSSDERYGNFISYGCFLRISQRPYRAEWIDDETVKYIENLQVPLTVHHVQDKDETQGHVSSC